MNKTRKFFGIDIIKEVFILIKKAVVKIENDKGEAKAICEMNK